MPSRRFLPIAVLLCFSTLTVAVGATRRASTVSDLTSSAARIFRGICERVEVGSVTVAGARLPMTTYTFRVSEGFKGSIGTTLTFRQIGVPGGGPMDLGQRAGLPVYSAGGDYLLFLLPESRVGLTSPAGAAQGAFEILADQALALNAMPVDSQIHSYQSLRRQVLQRTPR